MGDLTHQARNEALKMLEPLSITHLQESGPGETLGSTLQAVYKYIDGCNDFDVDPLQQLRIYFPDFTWQLHKPSNVAEVCQILHTVDYALPGDVTGDWSTGFFTITCDGWKRKRKICFCPANFRLTFSLWPYAELAKIEAQILINDSAGILEKKPRLHLMDCNEVEKLLKRK